MTIDEFETGSDELLVESDGDHVAVITLNRPERRNALSNGIYEGLAAVLPHIASMPEIRVVMLTGAGGAFCAGGDVKGMNERNVAGSSRSTEEAVADLRMRQRAIVLGMRNLPQPIVAAIPGPVAGAGLSIAMAADLRLASDNALVVTAFSSVGASGDFGGSWLLSQLVGPAKAKELYFLSPRLSAAEALDLGIVNRVMAQDSFVGDARQFCQELAERPPLALRYMKENFQRAESVTLAEALDAEAAAMVKTMSTRDHKEAAAAFVEKRNPVFRGH